MRVLGRLGALLAGLLIAVLSLAPRADAHAVVVGSDPADGSRLSAVPSAVTIRFDEPVGLALGYLKVVDNRGRNVQTGAVSHPAGNGSAITVALRPGLGDGGYLASFRVVSADSHPVGGSIRFVVGDGPMIETTPNGSITSTNRRVQSALAAAHGISFLGLALLGGSWLIFTVWPRGQRRPAVQRTVWIGWYATALATAAEFGLQGVYVTGGALGDLFTWRFLDATLHENTGQMLSLRLVLLGLLGAVFTALFHPDERRRPVWGAEAAAIIGLGVVVTFAATGHSQAANPRWLAVLVAALHLLAMAIWFGGLLMLLVASYSTDSPDGRYEPEGQQDSAEELAAGLPIFSRVALGAIATLVVTGTIQAWREIGTIDAIATTWYGRLVSLKVVLFIVIVGLGYLSRRVVLSRPSGADALRKLRRSVGTEVVTGIAVLAASGVLIIQPPGKAALAAVRAAPQATTVQVSANSQARVELSPGIHGPVQLKVEITGGATPLEVTATASLPSRQLGPINADLKPLGPRSYVGSSFTLPAKGDWQITVNVRTSEFVSNTAVATLHLF